MKSFFRKFETILLGKFVTQGVIIFLSMMIVLLIYQNYKLKLYIDNINNSTDQFLKKGELAQDFKVYTLDGDSTDITFKDRIKRFLFFIFSTKCPYCERNLTYWNSIAKSKPSTCDIMGIAVQSDIEKVRKYISEKSVNFRIVIADTNFMRQYKIAGVPLTVLVDSAGVVDNLWFGELDSIKVRDLGKYFNTL